MAGRAAFDFGSGMLVQERTAFLNVTSGADLEVDFAKQGTIHGAVRFVTIRALDLAFRNPMMRRQRKLRLDRLMTGKTEIRLLFLKKAFAEPTAFLSALRRLEELLLGESR